ncbi:MAG: hypothetical protein ABI995_02935 [Acidobacteriota bacterium]
MLNPNTLLVDSLLPALRSIPELVALLDDDPERIEAFVQSYPLNCDLELAIRKMRTPSILLAHSATTIANSRDGINHQFSAYLRPQGEAAPLFVAMREGVPTAIAGGQKFKFCRVHPNCHEAFLTGFFPRIIPIDERTGFTYHEIPIILTERTPDN